MTIMPASTPQTTPLMQQYREIKDRHQNAILFFRMGEFYEMFYDDAQTASRVLGLTLTARNNGAAAEVPLAGVPVKAAGDYVRRLVQQVVAGGASVTTPAKDTSPGFVIALSPLTEIPGHPGTKLFGPLPKELQVRISFSAVLGAHPSSATD